MPHPLHARLVKALPVVTLPGPLVLRHHAATAHSGLSKLAKGPPYWAYLWPGGAALIAHLVAHPGLVRGKRVLDLGAGSGLVGIAAARLGAAHVIASEVDPVAVRIITLNAALNQVALTLAGDLLAAPAPDRNLDLNFDLVLVGDLFYAPDLVTPVLSFLSRLKGVQVLVGDIGRPDLPRARFRRLAAYPVREVGTPASSAMVDGLVLELVAEPGVTQG